MDSGCKYRKTVALFKIICLSCNNFFRALFFRKNYTLKVNSLSKVACVLNMPKTENIVGTVADMFGD